MKALVLPVEFVCSSVLGSSVGMKDDRLEGAGGSGGLLFIHI